MVRNRYMAKILKPKFDSVASKSFGALREGVHLAGYSFERACTKLEWLLDCDRWRGVGSGFDDVNDFLSSIKLDHLKAAAEQRKRVALKIKQLRLKASNRAIARVILEDYHRAAPIENAARRLKKAVKP